MIEFELSKKQQRIREMVHMFASTYVRPYALQADREGKPPEPFLKACAEFGLGSGAVPKDAGGEGEGLAETFDDRGSSQRNRIAVIGAEEMAWGDPAVVMNLPGPGLGAPPVQFMGTPEQKQRFLGMFKPNEVKWGAYALTEPNAGSDAAAIRTSCRKDGDHWVLNGHKFFITNGAKAEWNVVFATVDPAMGRAGHRTFVVEKGTPGFGILKIEKKMGLRASETADLVFEDCRVPADNLLGGEAFYEGRKEGFRGAMKTFDATRPLVASMAVGIARAAYEEAARWAKERFALSQHTQQFHTISDKLARMKRDVDLGRLLCWRAAWLLDVEKPNSKESSMAKGFCGSMVQRVTSDALEILGPEGVLHENLVEKLYRDQKVWDIFEGTGQIQRVVISRRIFDQLS